MTIDEHVKRAMNGNAPVFDPLKATSAESADMLAGYRDGFAGNPPPRITTAAYDWGRKCGANDKAGVADDDQREVARRKAEADQARLVADFFGGIRRDRIEQQRAKEG